MSRIQSTIDELLALPCRTYCDLGPGRGALSIGLKKAGRTVVSVEAPWANKENFSWAEEHGIPLYSQEFFTGDLGVIKEPVDCYILAHSIAHFRFSPYVLFEKIHRALPVGGYFYLSTVNGTSFERVLNLFRGQPLTERVSPKLSARALDISKDWNRSGLPQIWDDWMHVKEYALAEVRELFTNSGFTIHSSHHRNNYTGFTRSRWKKNVAISMFPHMADENVVIGRK